jgi:hypothetical protein
MRGRLGVLAARDAGTRFANAPICKHEGRRIEPGREGVNTALPWVRFIAQAHNDRGGNPNHAMLIQKVFVDVTNCEDAERQAKHGLAKKRRVKLFYFVCTIKKNQDGTPLQSARLGGHLSFCAPLPPSVRTLLWEVPILPPGPLGRPLNVTPPSGRSILLWRRTRMEKRTSRPRLSSTRNTYVIHQANR